MTPPEGSHEPIEPADFARGLRTRHPRLRDAIPADARTTAEHRGERHEFRSGLDTCLQVLRLIWVSDGFPGQVLYRIKARLQAVGIPVLPRIAHRLAIATSQISIGDPVLVHPGLYLVHGQVVIDGLTEIGPDAVIAPFVTIGLRAGDYDGPTLAEGVSVGTGAKIIGPVRIGAGARIGANSVVTDDVAPGATVVGAPARPVAGT